MDVVAINALTNHNSSPTYVTTQPVVAGGAYAQPMVAAPAVAVDAYQDGPAVIYQREETHFWRNTIVFILGLALCYGVWRFYRSLLLDYKKSV
jgi:hypothetical protein